MELISGWEKGNMADMVNSLPTIYRPFFLGAVLFRKDNVNSFRQ